MKTISSVRPSPIAGQWYPADPRRLAAQVDHYIQQANLPVLDGEVVAVVTPHAGHIYSGAVAGYAFAAIRDRTPEVVAVISPMHRFYNAPLLTTAHAAYETPLGLIEVSQELVEALHIELEASLGYGLARVANDLEHSLEIELPFLQRALKQRFKLLPVMVRDQNAQIAQALGQALGKILSGREALLVASTDLSHYQPRSIAQALDMEMLRRVQAFDPQAVIEAEEQGCGYACGRGAVAAVLWAAKALLADKAHLLHYATSGDVTGDYSEVVGYGAAAVTRPLVNKAG